MCYLSCFFLCTNDWKKICSCFSYFKKKKNIFVQYQFQVQPFLNPKSNYLPTHNTHLPPAKHKFKFPENESLLYSNVNNEDERRNFNEIISSISLLFLVKRNNLSFIYYLLLIRFFCYFFLGCFTLFVLFRFRLVKMSEHFIIRWCVVCKRLSRKTNIRQLNWILPYPSKCVIFWRYNN